MRERVMRFFVVITIGICMSMPLAVSAAEEPVAITVSVDTTSIPVADQCLNPSDKPTLRQATVDGDSQATDGQEANQTDSGCGDQPQSVSWNS